MLYEIELNQEQSENFIAIIKNYIFSKEYSRENTRLIYALYQHLGDISLLKEYIEYIGNSKSEEIDNVADFGKYCAALGVGYAFLSFDS